jgi:hypothetical protein
VHKCADAACILLIFYSIFVALADSNKRERKRQDMQQTKESHCKKQSEVKG